MSVKGNSDFSKQYDPVIPATLRHDKGSPIPRASAASCPRPTAPGAVGRARSSLTADVPACCRLVLASLWVPNLAHRQSTQRSCNDGSAGYRNGSGHKLNDPQIGPAKILFLPDPAQYPAYFHVSSCHCTMNRNG